MQRKTHHFNQTSSFSWPPSFQGWRCFLKPLTPPFPYRRPGRDICWSCLPFIHTVSVLLLSFPRPSFQFNLLSPATELSKCFFCLHAHPLRPVLHMIPSDSPSSKAYSCHSPGPKVIKGSSLFSKCQNPHLTSNTLQQAPLTPVVCLLTVSETLFQSVHAAALSAGSFQMPSLRVMFLPESQDPGQISEATVPFPTQPGEPPPHLSCQSPMQDCAYLMALSIFRVLFVR